MSAQRKLNALLFELQTARSPLAQAKILARGWRTLRELSPTDRKLLARHVGFEGAEEMLEGLAARRGGWAPAMLLQVLSNARNTDASSVSDLIDAIGDPDRREEALGIGADLAADLLSEPEPGVEEVTEEIADVVEEVAVPIAGDDPSPEEALAALRAVEEEGAEVVTEAEGVASQDDQSPVEGGDIPTSSLGQRDVEDEIETAPVSIPPAVPVVDWSRWDLQPTSQAPPPTSPAGSAVEERTFGISAEPELGILSRLRRLHRSLPDLMGSGADSLRVLLEDFPQGWARRRALAALLQAGIPRDVDAAVELVATMERPLDRRWCLGILARRGDLTGDALARAVELLTSPAARRRILAIARG